MPGRHPRASVRAGAVLVLAGALLAPAAVAQEDSPREARERVEQRLTDTATDVEHSTRQLADATARFRAAQSKLPGAERALDAAKAALVRAQATLATAQARYAVAAGALQQAQAAEAAAVAELQAAQAEVRAALLRVATAGRRIDRRQDDIGRVAAAAYQRGGVGDFDALALVIGADSLEEFRARVTYVQSALTAQGVVVDQMRDHRATLANDRVVLQEARDRARRAREQAVQARLAAQAAYAEAQAARSVAEQAAAAAAAQESAAAQAASTVQSLVAQREGAVGEARAARQADLQRYAALEAERARLEAIIRARAEAARRRAEEQARREAEERARREAEARERDEESGGDGGDQGTSGPGTDPPAPPAPAPAPPDSGGGLTWPIPGAGVTSPYGPRLHPILGYWKLHDGTDFGAGCGVPIRAAAGGQVVWASYQGGYGNQVLVDHGWLGGASMMSSYSHLSTFAVGSGSRVSRGEVIGYVGSTGYSTGCHLHFMVYLNGSNTDPMRFL
jgi:murein DD-endopeptidase MepM/ murein hydrolase activator NlpD